MNDLEALDLPGEGVTTVLTGREELCLFWSRWQRLMVANVVGHYTRDQLLSNRDNPLISMKSHYWKMLCRRSLPDVFNRMATLLEEVHRRLTPSFSEKELDQVKRSWISLHLARELYLGELTPLEES